ncbi:MAG: MFS transporter [Acidimicrobiia bacterium]|nr:MFS transporter [Acidimicrobiia bacterium]
MSRRQLAVLTLAVFVLAGAVGQVLPLLGELEAEYELPSIGVGLLAGTAFFASVIGQITLAPLADRGHTNQLLVGAVVASAVGSALFVVADGLPLLVLGRFITGLGLGAFMPAARGLVAAQNPAQAGQYLGRLQAVELAGFLTGPIIGAELASAYGLDAPFLASAVLAAAFVPIVLTLRLPQLPAGDRSTSSVRQVFPQLLRRPNVQVAVLLSIALIAPAGLYEAVWDIYIEDRGGSDRLVALSLAVYGLMFIVMAPIGGRLADRRGAVPMGLAATALIAPLTIVYGWVTVPLAAAFLVAFEAVLNGLGMPAAQSAMAKATGPGEQATGQGLAGASGEVSAGMLALLAAPLYREFGAPWLFTTVAVGIAAVALVAAQRHRVAQAGTPSSARSSTTTTPSVDDSVADVALGSADVT